MVRLLPTIIGPCPASSSRSNTPERDTAAGRSRRTRARCRARSSARSREVTGQQTFEFMGSGRTDAGVHALAQVAHLEIDARMPAETLRAAVNDGLPADIHVLRSSRAPHRFHARHGAVARSYLYQICRRRSRVREAVRVVGEGAARSRSRDASDAADASPACTTSSRSATMIPKRSPPTCWSRTCRSGRGRRPDPRPRRRLALHLEDGAAHGRRAGGGGHAAGSRRAP